jgi:hypothetical protein
MTMGGQKYRILMPSVGLYVSHDSTILSLEVEQFKHICLKKGQNRLRR